MPRQQIDLLIAIQKSDTLKFKGLLMQGVDPFVSFIIDGREVFLFESLLKSGNAEIVKIAFDHALKSKRFVDLSGHFSNDVKSHPLNILQFAACDCKADIFQVLFDYAKATQQNPQKILDLDVKCFSKRTGSLIIKNFVEVFMYDLNKDKLISNLSLDVKDMSPSDVVAQRKYLKEWRACSAKDSAPEFEKTIHIFWEGPYSSLERILLLGLELKGIEDCISNLLRWSKDVRFWDDLKNRLGLGEGRSIEATDEVEMLNGKVTFNAFMTNKFGAHKIKVKITLDFTPICSLVHKAIDARQRTNPAIAQLASRQEALEAKVADMNENVLADIRVELKDKPKALHCFNHLQRKVKAFLLAHEIAGTKMFAIKATNKSAIVVKTATAALNFVSQTTGIVGGAIAGVAAVCIQEVEQYQLRKRTQTVMAASEGLDIERLAIDVAALITAKVMDVYGEDINEKLVGTFLEDIMAEIQDSAGKFENQAELTIHLFSSATSCLPEKARSSSGRSSPSTSTGSGNNSPKPIVTSFDKAKAKASGDSDEAIAMIAIQDANPAKRTGWMRFICA